MIVNQVQHSPDESRSTVIMGVELDEPLYFVAACSSGNVYIRITTVDVNHREGDQSEVSFNYVYETNPPDNAINPVMIDSIPKEQAALIITNVKERLPEAIQSLVNDISSGEE